MSVFADLVDTDVTDIFLADMSTDILDTDICEKCIIA